MGSQLVRNELLCFAMNHCMRFDNLEVKNALLEFYGEGAISEAKQLLWDQYQDDLPAIERRTNRGSRSIKEKEIDDILKAITDLHAKYASSAMPVAFVALDMRRLPAYSPGQLNPFFLLDRVMALERQVVKLSEAVASPVYHDTTSLSFAEACKGTHGPQSHLRLLHSDKRDATSSMPANGSARGSRRKASTVLSASAQQLSSDRHDRNDTDATNPPDSEDDGFTLVKKPTRRAQRPKAVIGKKQGNCDVKAGLRLAEFFVFRVHQDVSIDQLKKYVSENSALAVVEAESKSRENAASHCYKLVVEGFEDPFLLMREDFWPEGVGCRKFYKRKQ